MAMNLPTGVPNGTVIGNYTYDSSVPGWRKTPEVASGLPAGTIVQWGTVTPPANWLICDGSAISRTNYASLFAAIGTTYGSGDGTTTFNLPDLPKGDAAGIISNLRINSQVTVTGTMSDLSGIASTVTFKAGRTYKISFSSPNLNGSSTARARFDFYVNGAEIDRAYTSITAGAGGVAFNIPTFYTPPADGTYVVKIRGMVDAGSGTLTVYGDGYASTFLTVEDLGESSDSLRQRSIIKTSAGITSGDSELATRIGIAELDIDALQLADSTTNKSGLVPIIPSSVSVNAGSASVSSSGVVSFTGCVTLTINTVFSSTYSNYFVVCSAESTAAATDIYYRLVEPSGTILSSYYGGRYSVNSSGVNGANWNSNIASAIVSRSNGSGGFALQSVIFSPYESKIKRILTSFFEPSTAGNQAFYSTSTASHTSLIIRSDQTMNSGTVTIYGMR